jgi:hypothetical protein
MTANLPARKYRDYFVIIFAILAGILAIVSLIPGRGRQQILAWDPVLLWLAWLALLTVVLLIIGRAGTERWPGILIDSQFKMSLSRLQVALWTLLVLSAYITIAIHRLSGDLAAMDDAMVAACKTKLGKETFTVEECGGGAINITFPSELLIAMGISAASFAGTSMIQSNKKNKQVDMESKTHRMKAAEDQVSEAQNKVKQMDKARSSANEGIKNAPDKEVKDAKKTAREDLKKAERHHEQAKKEIQIAEMEADGILHKNSHPSDARFADLFRGDEIENCQLIDMSKVQMFFLTIVVVVIYGAAVAATLHDAEVMKHAMAYNFPSFSGTLNSLLAISHGTYLSVNTVDHTKTAS